MPRKSKQTPPEAQGSAKPRRSRELPTRAEQSSAPPAIEPVNPQTKMQGPPTEEEAAMIAEFRARYPFALDPFQEEAIAHLATGESAMVAAPTGTGKTVVAEFG